MPEFVCDAVNLEGINITLPEVQTLLDGVTVGGRKIEDQEITLNQINAWRLLFNLVNKDQFELSAEMAKRLHAVAGKNDALESGNFRSGSVTIAGTDYLPPKAEDLPSLFDQLIKDAWEFEDIYDHGIFVFLKMAKNQFFYDVNMRMGRFMMNGILLQAGYPAINVPAQRQLEFNQLMLDYYATDNKKPMNHFLRSCLEEKIVEIMKE